MATALSTSYQQQQTDPEYEEVQTDPKCEVPVTSGAEIELRENVAYKPVQMIELRENVALICYLPSYLAIFRNNFHFSNTIHFITHSVKCYRVTNQLSDTPHYRTTA